MNFQTIKQEVLELFNGSFNIYEQKYIQYVLGFVLAILVAGGLGYGYSAYRNIQNSKAFEALSECIVRLDEFSLKKETVDWQELVTFFEQKKREHVASGIAPYFDILISDVLIKDGKIDGALELLKNLRVENNALRDMLRLKYALILVDQDAPERQKDGFVLIDELTKSADPLVKDAILYQSARCYFAHNDQQKAKQLLQQLVDDQAYNQLTAPSYWSSLARVKLGQLL
ncbi:tetratricopeptide repeat protein [bacterium]|nr:MAG: tetratricopeptide repeat protein [bacterium]QQR61545.1 MAG: tetratricopeptide repeat protein [bacterium]QQR62924.1 MAG: tetratricopeptide repeat protein [bacterium]